MRIEANENENIVRHTGVDAGRRVGPKEEQGLSDRSPRILLQGGAFFEGPRWRTGRWWVSDFYRHLVLTVDPEGGTEEVLVVDGQPSGLGWMPDGSLLVVSMRDHRILRWSPDTGATVHADVREYCGGHLNDMVVDRDGRAYAGNFGFDLRAEPTRRRPR